MVLNPYLILYFHLPWHYFLYELILNFYILEDGEIQHQKAQIKFQTLDDKRTHNPLSSISEALTTELLEAIWRAGSKFNYNYTGLLLKFQVSG